MQILRLHCPLKIRGMSSPFALPRPLQVLLAGVSRSFGLSLRLLPAQVRPVISLAYLLARISDTLADASNVTIAHRQNALQTWLKAVDSPLGMHGTTHTWPALLQAYRQASLPSAELTLLEQSGVCLQHLATLASRDQEAIRRVMAPIGQGQQLDLQRGLQPMALLDNEDDLNTYTWQVAGCVGRFWTDCLEHHLPHLLRLPAEQLRGLGEHYGCGLQRLNILLDTAQDLRSGRCYFPVQSLQNFGLTPEQLQQAVLEGHTDVLVRLAPLQAQWFMRVEQSLRDGLRYSCALDNWRLRLASALPALVGAASLQLLRQQPTKSLTQRLKWPRAALRKHLLLLIVQGASCKALERHFEQLLQAPACAHSATIAP
jgi:farnesyl-diphosphate farnesyltransferase